MDRACLVLGWARDCLASPLPGVHYTRPERRTRQARTFSSMLPYHWPDETHGDEGPLSLVEVLPLSGKEKGVRR